MAQEDWDGELEYLRGEFARVCGYNDRRQKFIALIGRTLGVDSLTLCGEVDRVEAAIQERLAEVVESHRALAAARKALGVKP